MTDLSRLKVSTTKHNAHKIAVLLKKYRPDQVLDNLAEVRADKVQTRKNLSVQPGNVVPAVWTKAKQLGEEAVDALLLVGIIFSHHELISVMANASGRVGFAGRIERASLRSEKAYTNFARVVDQLGYATQVNRAGMSFNFKPMFEIHGLGPLVRELIELKLARAQWDRRNSVEREAVALGFQRVFGATAAELKAWLSMGSQPAAAANLLITKDEEFFQSESEGEADGSQPFKFRSGHVERGVEPVTRTASPKTRANQLHNDIQNKLYAHLSAKLGRAHVGTEIRTGSGTTIDAVTRVAGEVTFYEIKTSTSVRTSIRQAIPQLLEYAFWPNMARAQELVIVSHLPLTKAASKYLAHLRGNYQLPLSYRQFDLKKNVLL